MSHVPLDNGGEIATVWLAQYDDEAQPATDVIIAASRMLGRSLNM